MITSCIIINLISGINNFIMTKRHSLLLIFILVLIISGCIKETYNMNKLSDKIKYSPSFSIVAANGNISFSDLVKQSDTVKFDSLKFVKVVFKKDSVINFKLKDYFDLSNMVAFNKGYKVGNLKLDDFQTIMPISLNTISNSFSPVLKALFNSINGTYANFPSFAQTDIGEKTFSAFSNFQNAVFASGTITISVKNNLSAPLNSIKISLFNTTGHTAIGNQLTIPAIAAGATQSATLDLTGKTLTNSIIAAIVLSGSPGTSTPVLIDLTKTIDVGLSATNLQVQSGRVILPDQPISYLSGVDVVSFNPGNNIEIERLRVTTGNIGYTLVSSSSISGSFTFSIPTNPVVAKTININGPTNLTGSISLNNTDADLSTDVTQNFNRIPVNYSINVNSNGALINFSSTDSVHININMSNPNFDYVKGYFGQMSEQINQDDLKTGIDEILNHMSGQIHIINPSIALNYSNSFGIPIQVTLNATGKRNSQNVNLGLLPFTIAYPTSLTTRDVTSSFAIDTTNSSLASLISLPPSRISFTGSGKMNPAGRPTGANTNYVFGNSRFLGSVEVDIPLLMRIDSLKLADTLDNFLKLKSTDNTSFMDSLQVKINANNGFPFGASLKVILYDSVKKVVIRTINATNLILPAPVDASGKVTGKTASSVTIDFSKDFFSAVNSANKVIFMFALNTTKNGTRGVKIYSDYSISFTATLLGKANINQ